MIYFLTFLCLGTAVQTPAAPKEKREVLRGIWMQDEDVDTLAPSTPPAIEGWFSDDDYKPEPVQQQLPRAPRHPSQAPAARAPAVQSPATQSPIVQTSVHSNPRQGFFVGSSSSHPFHPPSIPQQVPHTFASSYQYPFRPPYIPQQVPHTFVSSYQYPFHPPLMPTPLMPAPMSARSIPAPSFVPMMTQPSFVPPTLAPPTSNDKENTIEEEEKESPNQFYWSKLQPMINIFDDVDIERRQVIVSSIKLAWQKKFEQQPEIAKQRDTKFKKWAKQLREQVDSILFGALVAKEVEDIKKETVKKPSLLQNYIARGAKVVNKQANEDRYTSQNTSQTVSQARILESLKPVLNKHTGINAFVRKVYQDKKFSEDVLLVTLATLNRDSGWAFCLMCETFISIYKRKAHSCHDMQLQNTDWRCNTCDFQTTSSYCSLIHSAECSDKIIPVPTLFTTESGMNRSWIKCARCALPIVDMIELRKLHDEFECKQKDRKIWKRNDIIHADIDYSEEVNTSHKHSSKKRKVVQAADKVTNSAKCRGWFRPKTWQEHKPVHLEEVLMMDDKDKHVPEANLVKVHCKGKWRQLAKSRLCSTSLIKKPTTILGDNYNNESNEKQKDFSDETVFENVMNELKDFDMHDFLKSIPETVSNDSKEELDLLHGAEAVVVQQMENEQGKCSICNELFDTWCDENGDDFWYIDVIVKEKKYIHEMCDEEFTASVKKRAAQEAERTKQPSALLQKFLAKEHQQDPFGTLDDNLEEVKEQKKGLVANYMNSVINNIINPIINKTQEMENVRTQKWTQKEIQQETQTIPGEEIENCSSYEVFEALIFIFEYDYIVQLVMNYVFPKLRNLEWSETCVNSYWERPKPVQMPESVQITRRAEFCRCEVFGTTCNECIEQVGRSLTLRKQTDIV